VCAEQPAANQEDRKSAFNAVIAALAIVLAVLSCRMRSQCVSGCYRNNRYNAVKDGDFSDSEDVYE